MAKIYGKSLSLCIRALCRNEVALRDVEAIVSSTRIDNLEKWGEVIRQYSKSYWRDIPPVVLFTILSALTVDGAPGIHLVQPRLQNANFATDCSNGIWANSLEEALEPYGASALVKGAIR